MKSFAAALLLAAAWPATAVAQDALLQNPEDQMLLDGEVPTEGAFVPSAPEPHDVRGGVELETLDEALGDETATTGGSIPPEWVGLDVVTPAGEDLGEVEDVITGGDGTVEALIVRRADGTMETASMDEVTYTGGRIVTDGSALE